MTAIALPQPHSAWLERLRSIQLGLGARGEMGLGLGRAAVSAAAPWYLAGGAPASPLVYQPIGAASLAASYVNIVNPGTYDLAAVSAPSFSAASGWTYAGSEALTAGDVLDSLWAVSGAQFAIVARIRTPVTLSINDVILAKVADSSFSENQRQFAFRLVNGRVHLFAFFSLTFSQYRGAETTTALAGDAVYTVGVVYDGTQSGNGGLDRFAFYVNGSSVAKTLTFTSGALGYIQNSTAQLGVGAAVNSAGNASTYNYSGQIHALAVYPSITNHATWMPAVMAAAAAL